MSIFRTIAMFLYLFGYMIVHYNILRRGERALAAGDMDTVEQIVNKHIPHWSRQILHITGVQLLVEGLDNIPKDTACVFVGNHRSYYDIPLLLAGLDRPHGILAKEELGKIPLLTRYKGEEGGAGEFKQGAFRIAVKTGAPVVPVAITGARALFENNGNLCHPGTVRIKVLPPIQTAGMSRAEQKQLPDAVRQTILAEL